MAKHEQILVLDPPSDLKFKGRQAGARPSGAGAGGRAGERRRRRGGPAVLPSPPPRRGRASVGAAAPLRPSAPRLAVLGCRAGLRRGGEGAGRAPRRAQPGAAAAILRPAGAPRDLARALPARMASLPQGGRGTVGSSRGGAVREGGCESRSSGLCSRPPARPPAGGVRGLWAGAARGRGVPGGGLARRLPRSGAGLGRAGRPSGARLGLTPRVGTAPSARPKAVRQLGLGRARSQVSGSGVPLCQLGVSLGTEDPVLGFTLPFYRRIVRVCDPLDVCGFPAYP